MTERNSLHYCQHLFFFSYESLCSVSVLLLQHRALFFMHVFRQSGPPRHVDCLSPRWKMVSTQRLATTSKVEPGFGNLYY